MFGPTFYGDGPWCSRCLLIHEPVLEDDRVTWQDDVEAYMGVCQNVKPNTDPHNPYFRNLHKGTHDLGKTPDYQDHGPKFIVYFSTKGYLK